MASPSTFVWYDLMTTDMPAATAFYQKIIGWEIADSDMPGMEYSIITVGDVEVGGIMPVPPSAAGMPPMWNGYIGVADVDASARQAAALGGTIFQEPRDIPGVGRFAVIADPSGATFMLFKGSAGAAPVEAGMGTPGHVAWRELMHDGLEKTWSFYSALFGWTKDEAMDMGPMGIYQTFKAGGATSIGGMMQRSEGMPPSAWELYFAIPALDAGIERVKAAGGALLNGPMEVPGSMWVANCRDPQGARFSLFADKR